MAKAVGIPERQASRPGVESGRSLFGLIKHLTVVELNWFAWAHADTGTELWDDAAPVADGRRCATR
ncbi:DUF664 domain-containing protein [Streptomyces sp. NPDC059862]|uniref:mycothiol transferase n=1 Tax=Streptomyces sp. NPDC059862 TaxID=3346975 RepID=UPI00364C1392